MPVKKPILIRGGIAIGVIALVMGVFFGTRAMFAADSPAPAKSPSGPKQLTTVTNTKAGFTLKYPKGWHRFKHQDPPEEVPLLVGPGGTDFVLVRVCSLAEAIPPEAVPGLKAGFDGIIKRTNPTILQEKQVSLNGLNGFHYLYTFSDERLKLDGVHSHYFLVDGSTLLQLVFEAMPPAQFEKLAPTFDEIARSFRKTKRTGEAPVCSTPPPDQPPGPQPPAPPG